MAPTAASIETTATVLRATAGQVRLQLEDGREVAKRVTVPISRREALVGTAVPIVVTGTGPKARIDLAADWLDAGAPAKKAPARKPAAKKPAAKTASTKRAAAADGETAADAPAKKPATRRERTGGSEPEAVDPSAKPARKPRAKNASPTEAPVAAADAETEATETPKKRTRARGAKKAADAPVEVAAPDAPVEDGTEAATPGEAPSIAEEPTSKRGRSRRGRGKKPETSEAAIAESPAKADAPVASPEVDTTTPATLDPEVLRSRIATAVDLVRTARAS